MEVVGISKPPFGIKTNANALGNRLTANFLDFILHSRIHSNSINRGGWAIYRIKINYSIREVKPGNKLFLIFWIATTEVADYSVIHLVAQETSYLCQFMVYKRKVSFRSFITKVFDEVTHSSTPGSSRA